ncbi:glycosyltransferase family 8 protein [Litchfieldia alkalitelluris]|uniref:glycosyltransferase family 8 protein n=1 Tax=Litchfieldia alkalitelluris TaxID=304268 RepID=UPI000995E348|nr:glycosyltransferase family 8 protein [Litchfieldia alkalitelluris]
MELNVVYSSDDHYAQHVGVSMVSLFENNRDFTNINVYLIDNGISELNKQRLKIIEKTYKRKVIFKNFNEVSHKLFIKNNWNIALNAYARLFLPSLIGKNVDKILYFDSDSIINGSLQELWNININNYYVAGVLDTVSDSTKTKVFVNKNQNYLNSGMLLINLRKWREESIEIEFIKFIRHFNGNVFHHDQGTINGVLREKMLVLHPKYNSMTTFYTMTRKHIMKYYNLGTYYSENELQEAKISPIFIHFTPAFVNRPWIKGNKHPLKTLYKFHLEKTPWKGMEYFDDNRRKVEKMVAFLFNYFPFQLANSITKTVFK